MTFAVLGITLVALLGALVAAFIAVVKQNRERFGTHPSQLSANARSVLRPLRAAVESFESFLAASSDHEARILAGPAEESVRKSLAEAERLAILRDEYLEIARRANQTDQNSQEAARAAASIEQQIADAAAAIDRITLRLSKPAESRIPAELESDLPSLVANLENLSRSYDELKQTEQIHTDQ